jgi:hypothetical protein
MTATIPHPRVEPERARRRHRLACMRRHAQIVAALDELLGLRQPAPVDSVVELDYAAALLDRGVPEREAAGARWSG